jgi:Domain of unknown function (DUF4349)
MRSSEMNSGGEMFKSRGIGLQRSTCLVLAVWMVLLVTACRNESSSPERVAAPAAAARNDMSAKQAAPGGAQAETASAGQETTANPGRFIALRHSLTLETSASRIKPVFESWAQRCVFPHCELQVANFAREAQGTPASATLEMRIQPKQADGFIAALTQDADIVAHNRSSEDRTDQVIDVEAQQKNLTQLRDQLRAMLSQRSGSLKDTLEVQRELANTQSRLDSLAGMRKVLANETEKVSLSVNLQAKPEPLSAQVWSPLREAWQNMGSVTASSTASIVTFVAAILPWLVIGLPVLWLLRRVWKRRAP